MAFLILGLIILCGIVAIITVSITTYSQTRKNTYQNIVGLVWFTTMLVYIFVMVSKICVPLWWNPYKDGIYSLVCIRTILFGLILYVFYLFFAEIYRFLKKEYDTVMHLNFIERNKFNDKK